SLLKHPHIVGVVDYGITSDEGPYLAMEYIEGQTLDKILQFEHQLSPERAKNICLQVAEAMNYAHQCGYLHRDLKPANIMVSTVEGRDWVQVLDFGISDVEREPGDTSEISSRGSLCYMSPEQLLERPSSKRSDVYQLGLILFQCLTGNLPFRVSVDGAVMYRLTGEIIPVESVELLPAGVQPFLEVALARHCGNRFSSMSMFAHELARIA